MYRVTILRGIRMLLTMARAPDRRSYEPPRSEERLRAHWEIERALADRLRNASRMPLVGPTSRYSAIERFATRRAVANRSRAA